MSQKLLTVDDSRIVRMLVSRALAGSGLEIIEAANGEEGLAKAATERPDLVLLDVTMPVMDGLEMLKQMRTKPECAEIRVIMLTAESSQEYVERADGLKVVGYIAKPFTEELLRERVKTALAA